MASALVFIALLSFLVPPSSCSVTSVVVSPVDPVRGDFVVVEVEAEPGEEVAVRMRFNASLPVEGGAYFIELGGVEVPQGTSSLSLRAVNVASLVISVRVGLWISVCVEAEGGVASKSLSGLPAGRYDVQVKGDAAEGAGEVSLEVAALANITVGGDGWYSVAYDTSPIPPGTFTVDVGGVSRVVVLSEARPVESTPSRVPPIPVVSDKVVCLVGELVEFSASASYDPDGRVVSCLWDLGDGSLAEGVAVSHVYASAGLYNASLLVTDNDGLCSRAYVGVEVRDPAVGQLGAGVDEAKGDEEGAVAEADEVDSEPVEGVEVLPRPGEVGGPVVVALLVAAGAAVLWFYVGVGVILLCVVLSGFVSSSTSPCVWGAPRSEGRRYDYCA